MKKIITLILLLAVGAAAFFTGWVQFSVPIGSFGVLHSKTHGIHADIIQSGSFSWVWYKLIPHNVHIAVFNINETPLTVTFSGTLPSAELFSTMGGIRNDFAYSFSASLIYRIRAESLPELSEREMLLSQEDLELYSTRLSDEIEQRVRSILWNYGENEAVLAEIRETGTIIELERLLIQAFPVVEISAFSVKTLSYPDLVLYSELRELYRDYLRSQRSELQDEIALISAEHIRLRRRLDELAAYGELLAKYPILLQYMSLEMGHTPGILPNQQ